MEALSDEVLFNIHDNGLTLPDLVFLTPEEIRELCPRMKDRIELKELINKCKVCDYNLSTSSRESAMP